MKQIIIQAKPSTLITDAWFRFCGCGQKFHARFCYPVDDLGSQSQGLGARPFSCCVEGCREILYGDSTSDTVLTSLLSVLKRRKDPLLKVSDACANGVYSAMRAAPCKRRAPRHLHLSMNWYEVVSWWAMLLRSVCRSVSSTTKAWPPSTKVSYMPYSKFLFVKGVLSSQPVLGHVLHACCLHQFTQVLCQPVKQYGLCSSSRCFLPSGKLETVNYDPGESSFKS